MRSRCLRRSISFHPTFRSTRRISSGFANITCCSPKISGSSRSTISSPTASSSCVGEFVIGFLLAVFIDQKIRFEDGFRTIFLYPFALSGIVTGLVWEWMLNPVYGLEKSMHDIGLTWFSFDWVANREMVIYAVAIGGIWQGTGLVMALMLAGLRGIDDDIWKASRVDGIPKWRTYLFIVIPMMRPVFITSLVLVAANIVRTFDIVVAMTGGGPGYQSFLPANFVYEKLSSNLGQALAASATMMLLVVVIVAPWAFYEFGRKRT